MRLWLLGAILSVAAMVDIWSPLSLATPTVHDRTDPVMRLVSQQQQQSGSHAHASSPAHRPSPSVMPSTIAKRGGIHIQELNSNFLLHYHVFTTFTPSMSAFNALATFWFQLGARVVEEPDQFFLQEILQFSWGPMQLKIFNAGGGAIEKEFVLALANAMIGYTERGFCGMFNARISSRGHGGGETVNWWITFRIVNGLGQMIGV